MNDGTKKCIKLALLIFAGFLCIYYWDGISDFLATVASASLPLVIGCIIAYPMNIIMTSFEGHYFPSSNKKIVKLTRRPICLVLALISMIGIISLIIWLILPELTECIKTVIDLIPPAINHVIDFVDKYELLSDEVISTLENINWTSRISQIFNVLTAGVGGVVDVVIKLLTSVFSGIVTGLLAVIFSLYLLIGKDRLKEQFSRVMRRYMKPTLFDRCMYVFTTFNDCMRNYIVGQCTEAVILGVLCTIGMMIFRLPYASMIGALIAFTALIPVAGAYVGGAVGAFMIVTVSPIKALIFVAFLVILQQLEGNLIYPRVVGSSIGLPGIWVLATVTIGGGVMGIPGMFLGVPLAAALYRFLRDDVNKTSPVYTTEKASG